MELYATNNLVGRKARLRDGNGETYPWSDEVYELVAVSFARTHGDIWAAATDGTLHHRMLGNIRLLTQEELQQA